MTDISANYSVSNESPTDIGALLDQATEAFHKLHGDDHVDRGEQWDSHVATLHMVLDLTTEAIQNAQEG